MTHDDTQTAHTATDPIAPTPRLILTSASRRLLITQTITRGNEHPGLLIGHRYPHTVIVTHVESRYHEHYTRPSGRNIASSYDHRNGWNDGYRAALALSEQQQVGWCYTVTEPYEPTDLLTIDDASAILTQPEYRVHHDRSQPTDRILIVMAWVTNQRVHFHAIDLIADEARQQIMEIR